MAARHNISSSASFTTYDLDNPFAEGTFRWVAKGKYTSGSRCHQPCVTKWFKTGVHYDEHFYADDLRTVDKALELIEKWNDEQFVDKPVHLNVPTVWTFTRGSGSWAGVKSLVEPYIAEWEKFNSNSGWVHHGTDWPAVMQALSHYSYHCSGGQYVLCDLQGGIYRRGVVLSDPVILSRRRTFGMTDLGTDGILSFFSRHRCNHYCRDHWSRPRNARPLLPMNARTTMLLPQRHVPTRHSRAVISHYYEDDDEY